MNGFSSRRGHPAKLSPTARTVSLDVLRAVHTRDAFANLELQSVLRKAKLGSSDAAFATELSYGSLRMQGLYDSVISVAAGRPVAEIDDTILDILRLGAHQCLALHTPSHAAVIESVRLARWYSSSGAAGFTNAVMRRITERTRDEWVSLISSDQTIDQVLALTYSHPEWIVRALRAALAHESSDDEIGDLLESDNLPARVSLTRLFDAEDIPLTQEGTYSPRALTLLGGDPHSIEAVTVGDVRIQDEGSQLAALTLTRCAPIRSDERWLDLCAGPGGKTAILAAESNATGVTIDANEVLPHRADLVRDSVRRFPHVRVVVGDGREIAQTHPNTYDRILVDAPCSGLGALRRRPEARWRRTPHDVATLTGLQVELLRSALAALKPGGVLAYVTCSPHLVETRGVVNRVLTEFPSVTELDTREVLKRIVRSPIDLRGPDLSTQLWPHRHGTDAMFIALLTRAE